MTHCVCPLKVSTGLPVIGSQVRTVLSHEAEASCFPTGAKATVVTRSL